jgi:hypothetical protein
MLEIPFAAADMPRKTTFLPTVLRTVREIREVIGYPMVAG